MEKNAVADSIDNGVGSFAVEASATVDNLIGAADKALYESKKVRGTHTVIEMDH